MSDASSARPPQGDAALIRAVGTFALTAAVINVIIGGGIFRMPSALATQMGSAAPLALLAGAMAIVPVALCFAAIGSRTRATGGPYTYLTAVFGPFAGFVAGALMWISNLASSAGVAAAFTVQVGTLAPVFSDPENPWVSTKRRKSAVGPAARPATARISSGASRSAISALTPETAKP